MSQLSTEHDLHREHISQMYDELDQLRMLKHMRNTNADLWNQAVDLYMDELVSISPPGWEKLCPHCGNKLPEPEDSSS